VTRTLDPLIKSERAERREHAGNPYGPRAGIGIDFRQVPAISGFLPGSTGTGTAPDGSRDPYGAGFIYLIAGGELIKIGRAKNPAARLRDMRVGSPEPLELLAQFHVESMARFEGHLHRYFADRRHHGEWFRVSNYQEIIDELLRVCPSAGEHEASAVAAECETCGAVDFEVDACGDCEEAHCETCAARCAA